MSELNLSAFQIARLPRIEFGGGRLQRVPEIAASFGTRALLVLGRQSFQASSHWTPLERELQKRGLSWEVLTIEGEPSPEMVDRSVDALRYDDIELVIGIGGGSVLDAAKAVAGLLRVNRSVLDYLEGVGPELPYEGPAVPFIAVPTTAGTGSEATKNAVLSRQGPDGFKKSFRHEMLVPEYAVVDPDMLASCPSELIAANGMDALTQLLESYVSLRSNAFTDALAWSGLTAVRDCLLPWYRDPASAASAREGMAYGALVSGITLAQVGLGSVHGLASPLGALFPIPHGVVCGTLVGEATEINIRAMEQREPENPGLTKYARVAELLCQRQFSDPSGARAALVELLRDWTEQLGLPGLNKYGVEEQDLERLVARSRGSSMKTNPIVLSDDELTILLRSRL
jgi:alcohol dehydrogenase